MRRRPYSLVMVRTRLYEFGGCCCDKSRSYRGDQLGLRPGWAGRQEGEGGQPGDQHLGRGRGASEGRLIQGRGHRGQEAGVRLKPGPSTGLNTLSQAPSLVPDIRGGGGEGRQHSGAAAGASRGATVTSERRWLGGGDEGRLDRGLGGGWSRGWEQSGN